MHRHSRRGYKSNPVRRRVRRPATGLSAGLTASEIVVDEHKCPAESNMHITGSARLLPPADSTGTTGSCARLSRPIPCRRTSSLADSNISIGLAGRLMFLCGLASTCVRGPPPKLASPGSDPARPSSETAMNLWSNPLLCTPSSGIFGKLRLTADGLTSGAGARGSILYIRRTLFKKDLVRAAWTREVARS